MLTTTKTATTRMWDGERTMNNEGQDDEDEDYEDNEEEEDEDNGRQTQ